MPFASLMMDRRRQFLIGLLLTVPVLMGFTVLSGRDPAHPRVWNVVITQDPGEELDVRVERTADFFRKSSSHAGGDGTRCFIRDGEYVRREVGRYPARYIPCTTAYHAPSSRYRSSSFSSSRSSRASTIFPSSRITSTATGALRETGLFPSERYFPGPICGRAITIPILLQGEKPLSMCIL